ncbi:MAG: putative lipid II flippase FtsW [Methylomicrobium sp.]|nr:putative lipid II flippase FtsW [Methylomicrobium sp.]
MSLQIAPIKAGRFYFDPLLLAVITGLLLIGYVMVSSSSLHLGAKLDNNSLLYPIKQMIHIGLGLALAVGVFTVPLSKWEQWGPNLFVFGLVLLVLVLIPGLGVRVNGAVRWLSIGGFRIQVSEIVKLISVIYMASYVTRYEGSVRNSSFGLLKPLLLFTVACVLLLMEPDFGSAVVILIIALGVMFLAGARLWQFGILLASILAMAAMLVIVSPYRLRRVISFLDPWADPQDTGFQLVQALISFGRGEWFGVGLGSGIQKLFYLPEAHTDFLFSVIAEELGLLGVVTVIVLFALLVWRAIDIGAKAEAVGNKFAAFIAYGTGIWFGFQSFINMGVNMGMLPTKGLTLPLMSYGGGSMIVMSCALAILCRVNSEVQEMTASQPKRRPVWARVS